MKIAVIGSGHIGGTLGAKWYAAGNEVTYGARPGGEGKAGPGGVPVVPIADAVTDADVVVMAVPGGAVAGVVAEHGKAMDGKIVIDAANRMGGGGRSDSEDTITDSVPHVKYVRAFNTYGYENLVDPLPGSTVFYAADAAARKPVEELISAAGLEPACVGGANSAELVDGVLSLWFALVKQNRGHRKLTLQVLSS